MFVIEVHCTNNVALTGLEFSFPLAAPFFTGTGIELNSEGWCYKNAGQGLTPQLFPGKGTLFLGAETQVYNLHSVDTLAPKT